MKLGASVSSAASVVVLAVLVTGCSAERSAPPRRQVAGGDPGRGRHAIVVYGCGGCHAIPGVDEAESWVAPPLTRYGERAFVAGVISNNADNLTRWIMHPQEIDPRTGMPDLGVPVDDARDIAAYLYAQGGL